MKPRVVYASSMSSSAAPMNGNWKWWSITQIESKPDWSAVRAISASLGPSSAGPPAQVKYGICSPIFISSSSVHSLGEAQRAGSQHKLGYHLQHLRRASD